MSGMQGTFFDDVLRDYQRSLDENDPDGSFLYNFFLKDSIHGLLDRYFSKAQQEKYFSEMPQREPQRSAYVKAQMHRAMLDDKPRFTALLQAQQPPEKDSKDRPDFWQRLWLRDAACQPQTGLITDTAYYLWLIQYLRVRDIHYKDGSLPDGQAWLYELLAAGLQDADPPLTLQNGQLRRGGQRIHTKEQVRQALEELAQRLENGSAQQQARIAGRLHDLRHHTAADAGGVGQPYLPYLTQNLERMALHNKIRTWLRDSGHSTSSTGRGGQSAKCRRKDFSIQLFEAYLAYFGRGDMGRSGWQLYGREFCRLDPQEIAQLQAALAQSGLSYFYIPLAIHLNSGCVLLLVGKDIYENLYTADAMDQASKIAYNKAEEAFCYDYLRLDRAHFRASMVLGESFQLEAHYLENRKEPFSVVWDRFERYCTNDVGNLREEIMQFNGEGPCDVPYVFDWAFNGVDRPAPQQHSPEAVAGFLDAQKYV